MMWIIPVCAWYLAPLLELVGPTQRMFSFHDMQYDFLIHVGHMVQSHSFQQEDLPFNQSKLMSGQKDP